MGQAAIRDDWQTTGGARPLIDTRIDTVCSGHSVSAPSPSPPGPPEEAPTTAGWAVAVVALLLTAHATMSWGQDRVGQDADAKAAAVVTEAAINDVQASSAPEAFSVPPTARQLVEPVIAASMSGTVADKLNLAFELAVERVRDVPECGALFADLGCDGVDMLESTLYIPAHPLNEESVCRRGATAYTMVGASQTWVCRRFSALSLERAAMTVIHEALHHGGLSEAPVDSAAMNTREINTVVSRACGL
jgi:hypothetical protein